MDPLNPYERYTYNQYVDSLHATNAIHQKVEPPPYLENVTPNIFNDVNNLNPIYDIPIETQQQIIKHVREAIPILNTVENNLQTQNVEVEDSKEDLKPLLNQKARPSRRKGRTSSYWNIKITDKNFPFYGCTICDISFGTLVELDQHVTQHEGRITSYDIKLQNKKKKKLLKKEAKKAKKLGKKTKGEEIVVAIEIKPEDGYIGTEKASEVQDLQLMNTEQQVKENLATNLQNEPEASQTLEKENLGQNQPEASQNFDKENPKNSTENTNRESEAKDVSKETKKGSQDAKKGSENPKDGSEKIKNGEPDDPRLQKLFKCFACQKQFALSYYLKLHVRSHTGEKPYTCAVCGESFITASKMGRHNKRMHLAIKFTCRICYRNFNRFENLTKHFDKKHADDKLEGEPYDYNAILPYLKELEDQLQEKKETEALEKKERDKVMFEESQPIQPIPPIPPISKKKEDVLKTESDELWSDNWSEMEQLHGAIADETEEKKPLPTFLDIAKVKQERDAYTDDDNMDMDRSSPIDIVIEALKDKDNVVFKTEERRIQGVKSERDDAKDGSCSDSDYFPSNTWATKPVEPEAPQDKPVVVKKRYRKQDYPIKCDQCQKMITTPGYMRVHMRIHTGEKPFKCYVCDRGFITSSKMHRHVLTHQEFWSDDDEKPLKTEDSIKKEETTEEAPKEPKKKNQESIKRAKARINNKLREKRGSLKGKKREHSCQFCGKRFMHKATLLVHQKGHEGEELILKCTYCLEQHPDAEALQAHEALHVGPKPYLCTDCGRSYSKKESMLYHKRTHYPDDHAKNPRKSFICDICSKGFNAQCKLQKHLITHSMEKFVVRYECPVCAHMFNTQWHIQMHLQTHQREGLISEENRNEILAMVQQNARKIPLRPNINANLSDLIPSDGRSRVCNICGEMFQHFYYLEEHIKSHGSKIASTSTEDNSERKHICPVCNKGFKLGYYLKLHSFTHTKEKPYICQSCGKGFITKGKLKRHLETHTGLKKYQCHVCHKFFTRPGYLRIHVRTIHGTQDYNFKYMHQQY